MISLARNALACLMPLVILAVCPAVAEGLPSALEDCAAIFAVTGVPDDAGDPAEREAAAAEASPDAAGHTLRCFGGFALRLNHATKVPDWVAELLTSDLVEGPAERSDRFFPDDDPSVPVDARAQLGDYRRSGFDRGHQAPSGDFRGDQSTQDKTFVLSNMAPQVGRCFNQGIWKDLESEVRDWALTRGRLVVFTGPIYGDEIVTIGDKVPAKAGVTVAVPSAFYKIVYDPGTGRATGFLITNERHCGEDFADFTSSIDEIEEKTGYDFFPALDHRRQRLLESATPSPWGW